MSVSGNMWLVKEYNVEHDHSFYEIRPSANLPLGTEYLASKALIVNADGDRTSSLHNLVAIGTSLDAKGGLVTGVDDAGLRPDEAVATVGAEIVVAYPVRSQAEVSNVGGKVGLGHVLAGDDAVGVEILLVLVVAAEVGCVDGQAGDVAVGIGICVGGKAIVVGRRSDLGRHVRPRLEDVALRRLRGGRSTTSRRRPALLLAVTSTAGHAA